MPTEREIGELSTRVTTLERTVTSMDEKVTEIRDTMLRAEGGWRFMLALFGFGIAIGGLIAAIGVWLWPRT
jgi:wobble nucleotide-excising tRNase